MRELAAAYLAYAYPFAVGLVLVGVIYVATRQFREQDDSTTTEERK